MRLESRKSGRISQPRDWCGKGISVIENVGRPKSVLHAIKGGTIRDHGGRESGTVDVDMDIRNRRRMYKCQTWVSCADRADRPSNALASGISTCRSMSPYGPVRGLPGYGTK